MERKPHEVKLLDGPLAGQTKTVHLLYPISYYTALRSLTVHIVDDHGKRHAYHFVTNDTATYRERQS